MKPENIYAVLPLNSISNIFPFLPASLNSSETMAINLTCSLYAKAPNTLELGLSVDLTFSPFFAWT